jgi:ribosome-binding protein aMBF1 (putative translation factor)
MNERDEWQEYLDEQLENPEFRREWDALQPEYAMIQAMIEARRITGLTQKQLSEKTGIAQSDISKLERGNVNTSIKTLQRLASGMDMKLKIAFEPVSQ